MSVVRWVVVSCDVDVRTLPAQRVVILESGTVLDVNILEVLGEDSSTLRESLIFVEATTFDSDIDLTLDINGATLVSGPIDELRILNCQVDITCKEYKGTNLVPLST